MSDETVSFSTRWSRAASRRTLGGGGRSSAAESGGNGTMTPGASGVRRSSIRRGRRSAGAGSARFASHLNAGTPASATENEGAPFWLPQGVSFKIYDVPDADMQPIFRCRAIDGAPFHFLSLYSNCEGHIPDGQLGFVSTIQRPGLSQLFRCVSQNGRAHLTTMNIAECVGGNLRQHRVVFTQVRIQFIADQP